MSEMAGVALGWVVFIGFCIYLQTFKKSDKRRKR